MSSVLMTSTMKSEPGMPGTRASSRGVLVSASTVFAEGGRADGARGAFCGGASAARGVGGARRDDPGEKLATIDLRIRFLSHGLFLLRRNSLRQILIPSAQWQNP